MAGMQSNAVRGERQKKLHQSREANAQGSGLGVRADDEVQMLCGWHQEEERQMPCCYQGCAGTLGVRGMGALA